MVLLEHLETQAASLTSGNVFFEDCFLLLGLSILRKTFQHKTAAGTANCLWLCQTIRYQNGFIVLPSVTSPKGLAFVASGPHLQQSKYNRSQRPQHITTESTVHRIGYRSLNTAASVTLHSTEHEIFLMFSVL